jgi:hypothetical protein
VTASPTAISDVVWLRSSGGYRLVGASRLVPLPPRMTSPLLFVMSSLQTSAITHVPTAKYAPRSRNATSPIGTASRRATTPAGRTEK